MIMGKQVTSNTRIISDYSAQYEIVNPTTVDSIVQLANAVVDNCTNIDNHHSGPATVVILIILILIALLTVGGNFLVILAVILVRKLQTPSNILIVSLAFSDLLVGFLVLPFSIADIVVGQWPLSKKICDMYISFDVLLCTASILNLCAISIDRYLVITRPLTYVIKRTPCRMAVMIAGAWIISALICVPPHAWSNTLSKSAHSSICQCEYSESVEYQIFALSFAFYLPLLVMIVLYGRIFKLARVMSKAEQQRMVASVHSDQTNENHKAFSCTNVTPVMRHPDYSELQRYSIKTHSNSKGSNVTLIHADALPDPSKFTNGNTEKPDPSIAVNCVQPSADDPQSSSRTESMEQQRRKPSRNNSDSKVVKTLGVIMGCFCLCWVPFFTIQLIETLRKASHGQREENLKTVRLLSPHVFQILQWLGYVNSFLNPFIYAKFNREFRAPFKLILLCKCHNINARLRSVTFSAQYGMPAHTMRRRTSSWFQSISYTSTNTRRSRNSSVGRGPCQSRDNKPGRPRPQSRLHTMRQSETSISASEHTPR